MINFTNKTFLVCGINNKKSVAYAIAQTLKTAEANLILTTQHPEQYDFVKRNFPQDLVYLCDVSNTQSIETFANELKTKNLKLDGLVHSIAFANMNPSWTFEQTPWESFSEAIRISSYSLMELCHHLRPHFNQQASVVTISISTTKVTSYGYMGPIKSLLNSTIDYLAKSFASNTQVRFNSVGSGPLKTSASAGIPDYVDNYLYSEQLTLRKQALSTQEVANAVVFLLSPLSSGVNATQITVDAGMSVNYFDENVVKTFVGNRQ